MSDTGKCSFSSIELRNVFFFIRRQLLGPGVRCFPFPPLAIDKHELLTVTSCHLLSLSFSSLVQAGSGFVNKTGKALESAMVRRVVMWFTVSE